MAARFWVGGSGNWSDTAHWSLTSGGAGGQAVPTSSDDVTLDANSGAAATVTVDATANANTVTINKSDIILKMNAALTVVGATTLTSGTFNTNGQALSTGTLVSSNANTRTLTLGASVITITGTGVNGTSGAWDLNTTTGLTFTAGTSTIKFTNVASTGTLMRTGGLSYFNITRDVTGTTTQARASFYIDGDLTVTGTFTANGISVAPAGRITVVGVGGPSVGTAVPRIRTITAAVVSLSNVNFLQIVGAGAATWTGTSMGDCGSNTGITFDVPVTRFAVASGNLDSTTKWSTSTGGSTGASIPLPQDTAKLDANSPAGTYTFNWMCVPSIDCTGFTRTMAWGTTINLCGSLTLVSGMTYSDAAQQIAFVGDRAATFTQAGKSVTGILQVSKVGGTMTQQDDVSTTSANASPLRLSAGTWDMNGHNLTGGTLNTNTGGSVGYSEVRQLQMRGGTLTLNGTGAVWGTGGNATNLTVNFVAGSALIDITDTSSTSKTFQGAGLSYPKLRHVATGSAALTITGLNKFYDLDLECTTARSITLPSDTTGPGTVVQHILTLAGASGQNLTLLSAVPGSAAPLYVTSGHFGGVGSFLTVTSDVKLRRRLAQPAPVS